MPGAKARLKQRKFQKRGGMKAHTRRIKKAASAKGHKVKYGVLSDAGEYPDGAKIVVVAAVHEFGYAPFNIPERSFLRAVPIEDRAALVKVVKHVAKQVTDGDLDMATALGQVGEFAQGLVQEKIIEGPFAPNTAATIAAKGSSQPLNDTGLLRQSIRWEPVK